MAKNTEEVRTKVSKELRAWIESERAKGESWQDTVRRLLEERRASGSGAALAGQAPLTATPPAVSERLEMNVESVLKAVADLADHITKSKTDLAVHITRSKEATQHEVRKVSDEVKAFRQVMRQDLKLICQTLESGAEDE